MDKENVVYIYMYNGLSFWCQEKKVLPYATTWVDLEDMVLSETRQSQKDQYHRFHFCEVSNVVKCTKAENKIVVVRGWVVGEMESCFQQV